MYAQKKIALDNYLNNHKLLIEGLYDASGNLLSKPRLNNKQCYNLGESGLLNYVENQLIYSEFNYYQDTKTILGVHPVFRLRKLKDVVKKMSPVKADRRCALLKGYVYRDSKKLEKIKDPEKCETFKKRIALWQEEIDVLQTVHKLNE